MTVPRLPELFHIGWVVRDCAAAQRELGARLGAGPFVSAGNEARFDKATSIAEHAVVVDAHLVPVPVLSRIADRARHARGSSGAVPAPAHGRRTEW